MAKDERLWMRFPIDMHRDPKVMRLDDKAFRTFFEMNGEARLEGNDGVFTIEDAEFLWDVRHLETLCVSHPIHPLLHRSEGTYTIVGFDKINRDARYLYVVEWPIGIVKVGIASGSRRWLRFSALGASVVSVREVPASDIRAVEKRVHDLLAAEFPAAFSTAAEASPWLGTNGTGWTECYFVTGADADKVIEGVLSGLVQGR